MVEEAKEAVAQSMDKYFSDWFCHVFPYGYGTGEEPILEALVKFFAVMGDDTTYDHEKLSQALGMATAWLLINALIKADIFTYGTSPRYGFLEQKGVVLRDYMKDKSNDTLLTSIFSKYNAKGEFKENYGCSPQYCNCGPEQIMKKCTNPLF